MKISFAARRAPLTWGQLDIWRAIEAARPEESCPNIGHVLPAPRQPGSATVGRAADRLRDPNICGLRVHVGGVEISLAAGTTLLSPEQIEGYLRDVEALLVKAAA